jgi:alkaline phosphatase
MNDFHASTAGTPQLARRDWLKAAGIAASAALLPRSASAQSPAAPGKIKGVIFMVSDGMSPGVLTLADAYSRLTRKHDSHWCQLMRNPAATHGLMETASANSMVTDSAAASSCWGSGQRVNNGAINVTPDGKALTPIAEILGGHGVRTGLVSTATITHATPAGFASSVPSRSQEHDIAPQYLNRVDIILGGGSTFFRASQRPDKRDLIADFAAAGYGTARSRKDLLDCREEKILGVFSSGHMPYSVDHQNNPELRANVPTLAEMASAALDRFLAGDSRFLLQIEGARIDHAAHLNCIAGVIGDQLAFDDALAAVLARLGGRSDVLLIVTSDHGNANPGLNGMGGSYTRSNQAFATIPRMTASVEWLLTHWSSVKDGSPGKLAGLLEKHFGFRPTTEESEAIFARLKKQAVPEWNHQHANPEGLLGQIAGNRTGIGWTGTTHTSDPTIVTALGPHADQFSGWIRNTEIFPKLTSLLAG